MTIAWWKRCRIVQRALCLFLVPARTLPRADRASFSVSSARRAGYLIVYTPFAKLCWHEAPSDEMDVKGEAIMRQCWGAFYRVILITIQIFLANGQISR